MKEREKGAHTQHSGVCLDNSNKNQITHSLWTKFHGYKSLLYNVKVYRSSVFFSGRASLAHTHIQKTSMNQLLDVTIKKTATYWYDCLFIYFIFTSCRVLDCGYFSLRLFLVSFINSSLIFFSLSLTLSAVWVCPLFNNTHWIIVITL